MENAVRAMENAVRAMENAVRAMEWLLMQCALWKMQSASYQQCKVRVINNAVRAMENAHPYRELIDLPQVTFQIRS